MKTRLQCSLSDMDDARTSEESWQHLRAEVDEESLRRKERMDLQRAQEIRIAIVLDH